MVRVLRGLGFGALAGALMGAVARVLMRLAALDDGGTPSFHWRASLGVALLFALAGAGAGAAAAVGWRGWRRWLVVLLTSFLVVYMGVVIGLDEIAFAHGRHDSALPMVVLVLLALAIMTLALSTPYVGHRLGHRLGRRPGR